LKFSYNWIKELVPGLAVPPQELDRLITMKTAESEGFAEAGALLAQACAARVVSVEPIDGSHNRKAVVDTGRHGSRTVVCGAPNCRPGITTAWVPLGKKTISGIESDGMLASAAELGINRDHSGVIEFEAKPGEPIPGCAPDVEIDIDNKSLTHRPDLWGHLGMAREVAAITGEKLKDPVDISLVPDAPSPIKVSIQDLDLAPRYSALVVENVKVGPSPLWLQYRLEAIGLNPINNVVDVTNFVMAELAQPMHAFDADKLNGDTIYTRPAREGEKATALDGNTYDLTSANLVIADACGPIAIAGVIGGLDSAISEFTTRIVLESANFNAASVRKTSSRLKIRTDASMRFEKSQDPENTIRGLARAVALLKIVSPGCRVVGGLADQRKPAAAPAPIELPMAWLVRKLGRDVAQSEVAAILRSLEFGVTESAPGVLSVTVPSWRATKDVSIKDDLVEEVGRMIGYGSIVPTAPLAPATVPPSNPSRMFHRRVRALVAAQGFTEVYNYSFISDHTAREFQLNPDDHVRVANPISEDQGLLRMSLVPGIRKNILDNAKNSDSFGLFEIGREIHKRSEGLPDEVTRLAAAVYAKDDGQAGLFELKRLAECLMPGCEIRPAAPRPFEHPARATEVLWQGAAIGRLFEFHPSMIEEGRGAVLDINLDQMERMQPEAAKYKPIRRFPSSAFDLSIVAGARELVGDIEKLLRTFAGSDLEAIEFVRLYTGSPLPEGTKSVSFRLTVSAPDRTLSSDEVGAIRARIIDGVKSKGFDLRL
jgi:phenylalanyl-tRNA synthetase beta chain